MCVYSLEVRKELTRRARVGELLRLGKVSNHSCLIGSDGKVACIKPGTVLEVTLKLNDPSGYPLKGPALVASWDGKVVDVMMTRWTHHRYAADAFRMPDGLMIHISWLADGTTMRIPRKVRKDKGTRKPRNLDKVLGLDQIKADIPVTKTETVSG